MKHLLADYLQMLAGHGLLSQTEETLSERLGESLQREITLVSCDSRKVIPGTLFICKGAGFREDFLRMAKERGAAFYLSEKPYEGVDLPWIGVSDIRAAMAHSASFCYDRPWEAFRLVGITGTKGKSTTAFFLKAIFDVYEKSRGGRPSGLISTILTEDGKGSHPSRMTTPEPIELEEHFANAREAGLDYVTMEVSSQALKYDRVLDVQFDVAAFLNIGYDHISPIEHPTWEDYFASKLRIFSQCRTAVVHLGVDHSEEMLEAAQKARKVITFSETDEMADVYGYGMKKQGRETHFKARVLGQEREYILGIPGFFNVSNALAAIAVAEHYGIPYDCVKEGLKRARVPGRMEEYTSADGKIVTIIDYAHNRLSFEKLFAAAKEEFPGRRIVALFGASGGKAINRRRDLGEVAAANADYIYLTEDDPGREDPTRIAEEIASYIKPFGTPYEIIPDRKEAIRTAIHTAKGPTLLLLAGKGHEVMVRRANGYEKGPSDADCARKYLADYDGGLAGD